MKIIFFLFTFLFISLQSYCTVVYTQCNGNWNSSQIWQGGIIPSAGDSIYVNHNVRLTSDLALNNNYLIISGTGDICGCYSLTNPEDCYIQINSVAKLNSVTNDGKMVINGTLTTNNIMGKGTVLINGLLLIGWDCICSPISNNCYFPIARFSASDTIICEDGCIDFFDSTLNNPTFWLWQFNGSNTFLSNSQDPQQICYPNTGFYDVKLIVKNSFGSDTLTKDLYISVKSKSSETLFINSCQSYLSPDGLELWTSSGIYQDTVPNAAGCDSIIFINLTIDGCENILYIPNIFSPNEDGQNDVLYVKGKDIQKMEFFIYNRWGELIFESYDINKGWDGTYKGTILSEGVFSYTVIASFENGREIFKKGTITLVK